MRFSEGHRAWAILRRVERLANDANLDPTERLAKISEVVSHHTRIGRQPLRLTRGVITVVVVIMLVALLQRSF